MSLSTKHSKPKKKKYAKKQLTKKITQHSYQEKGWIFKLKYKWAKWCAYSVQSANGHETKESKSKPQPKPN